MDQKEIKRTVEGEVAWVLMAWGQLQESNEKMRSQIRSNEERQKEIIKEISNEAASFLNENRCIVLPEMPGVAFLCDGDIPRCPVWIEVRSVKVVRSSPAHDISCLCDDCEAKAKPA